MSAEGRMGAAFGRVTTRIARRLRHEAGFTLIEVLLTAVMLAIISAPISAILSQGAVIAKMARERTGADQLAQTQIESLRSIPYTQVGIANGNPAGSLAASTSTTLPSGEAVTLAWQVTWVNDKVPENPYQSNADYKKVVLTITRNSDNHLLTQKTTFVAAASAPPSAGTTWVQIKRTVQDAVTLSPIVGANVNLTGGVNSITRNDTTDASGTVLFPALDPATNGLGTPLYTLLTTYSGYSVFPDDISPGAASSISSTPGLSSISTIRMYKGTTLTVNVQTFSGAAYTSGATVSVDSSRCGVQTQAISPGQSSVTFTTCWTSGTEPTAPQVPLPPNVSGLTPADSTYYVTAWSTTATTGNWSTGTAVAVPSNYPTTLTQSVNVKMVSATFPYNATPANSLQKNLVVTVKKSGANDTNARVEVTGAPTGISPGIALYGTTNGSGQVTFTVPVVAASTTFTVNANELGVIKGSATQALQQSSAASTNLTVNIS
jgi:prepilin-type N-terminal cleavage/methylation domain-containing protein